MKKGYIYTALSAIIFGLMPLLTKIIIARGATSLTIPFFRVFYVTIVLFLVLKIKKIDLHLEKRDLISAILTSIFGSGLTIIILNESYNYVDTGIATSLHFLYPLFVAILCCFFYGEKIKKKQIISLSFALVGIICFMSKGNGSLFGYFLAIASGLTYAFYLVKMDKSGLVKMNALKLSFYLALFTTIEIFTMNQEGGIHMSRTVLCLQMLDLLKTNEIISKSELAKRLKTKKRNIVELRKELEQYGYRINIILGKQGGYQLIKDGTNKSNEKSILAFLHEYIRKTEVFPHKNECLTILEKYISDEDNILHPSIEIQTFSYLNNKNINKHISILYDAINEW